MDKDESRIKSMVEHLETLGFRVHNTSESSQSVYMSMELRPKHPMEMIRISDHRPIEHKGDACVQLSVVDGDWCDFVFLGDNASEASALAVGEAVRRIKYRTEYEQKSTRGFYRPIKRRKYHG